MMVIPSERQPIVIVIDDDASVREVPFQAFSVGRFPGAGIRHHA